MASVTRKLAFVYLHGLLSSGKAKKSSDLGKALADRLPSAAGPLYAIDLYSNSEEFAQYTISKGLLKVSEAIAKVQQDLPHNEGIVLIGSSCGGLLATRFMQTKQPGSELVVGLVLLAPALLFNTYLRNSPCLAVMQADSFPERQIPTDCWPALLKAWEETGKFELKFLPWGEASCWWSWDFMKDVEQNHTKTAFAPISVPVLLVQGMKDTIVPYTVSHDSWVPKMQQQGCRIHAVFDPEGNHVLSNVDVAGQLLSWLQSTFKN